jgi:magnesium transporter
LRSDAAEAGAATASPAETPPPPEAAPADRVRIVAVRDGQRLDIETLADVRSALAGSETCLVWLDLAGSSGATLSEVTDILGLHPLIAQDIHDRNERSKIVEIGDVLHIVLFALRFAGEADASEIDVVLGKRFLLTVHDRDWDPNLAPLLREGPEPLLAHGPDKLFYALADYIVDGYFPVLDRLADEIDQLQDDVVERASQWTLQKLFVLKRELIQIRRATSPAREVFNQLTNRDLALIADAHVVYFRDVYDHLIRVTDELDNYRELVSGTLDVYLSTVNNNLSLIMKRLTGVTVIVAGIGAVAGIFGMSEAGAAFSGAEAGGFWIVSAFTVAVAAAAAIVLRRIDWI